MGEPAPDSHPLDRLKRVLSLRDATLLVVSSVIGSGIFLTPGAIAGHLPEPGLIFLAWLVGGALALAGALANAELGAMYPRAGGDYVYLREAFHPAAGFLVGWLSFFVIYAGTIATLAAGFSAGFAAWVPMGSGAQIGLGIVLLWAVSALNYVGVRWGALANNVTAAFKIGALLAFCLLGPVFGEGSTENLIPLFSGTSTFSLMAFCLALSPVFFSYLGWNASVYVASEIRDPGRNVPRSLFIGVGLCTVVYLLMNAIYLYAIPIDALKQVGNAGEAAANALFGGLGGRLVAAFVLASILGTLNAMVLVGPRIAYAMALDGLFFRGVERAHAKFGTPGVAIALQAVMASVILLALESFERALNATTFAILLATLADVAALYRLRSSEPDRLRPYRAWGYPWVPAVYAVANAGVALALLLARPTESAIGLLLLALGLPFYWFFSRRAQT